MKANHGFFIFYTGNGQYYTGWSTSTTLVTKELIVKWGNPVKIRLTQAGEEMAEKIIQNRSVADAVLGDGARNNPLGLDLSSIFWTFQRKLSFFTRSQIVNL